MKTGYIYIFKGKENTLIQMTDDLSRTTRKLSEQEGQMTLWVKVDNPREVRSELWRKLHKFKVDDKGWFALPKAWQDFLRGYVTAKAKEDVAEVDGAAVIGQHIAGEKDVHILHL